MTNTTTFEKPKSNLACMLTGPNEVDIREFPLRDVGPEDVLVKVESTGICGSDLHNYIHGGVGTPIKEPLVLGHESAGVIVHIGSQVTDVKVGDRVAVEPTIYCRKCYNCRIGKPNVCRYFKQPSLAPTHGTLAEYYVSESDHVVKIPDHISWEIAGCIQPLAVAVQLARRARLSAGQTMAVFGCGPLGCMVMSVARAFGVSKILAFDILQPRLDFVSKPHTVDSLLSPGTSQTLTPLADYATFSPEPLYAATGELDGEGKKLDWSGWAKAWKEKAMREAGVDEWGVDVVVEASGAESCMHAGIEFVHNGGVYCQAGLSKGTTSFPTFSIVAKELDVIGTVRYTAGCYTTAVDLLARGKVDLRPMITKTFPLERSKEALEAVRKGEDLKVVIMAKGEGGCAAA